MERCYFKSTFSVQPNLSLTGKRMHPQKGEWIGRGPWGFLRVSSKMNKPLYKGHFEPLQDTHPKYSWLSGDFEVSFI